MTENIDPAEEAKPKEGVCRGCGQKIYWVKMDTGKMMPINPKRLTFIARDVYLWGAFEGYQSHFATCPKAGEFRKEKKRDERIEKNN